MPCLLPVLLGVVGVVGVGLIEGGFCFVLFLGQSALSYERDRESFTCLSPAFPPPTFAFKDW